jgi:D-arabinose 5-phosphate isomerase GutQ
MINKTDALITRARQIVEQESQAARQMSAQFDQSLAEVVQALFACTGHVLVTGAGTSRAVAERFAHLLSCCGTPALFIHAADSLHGASGAIKPGDVVYIISKGGHSVEINQFAQIARQQGALIIAHTEKPESPLGQMADLVFQIVAPPNIDPYGMIATGSSLVNSAACDALCVLLLEQRGYTKDDFGKTHPGGAVGKKLTGEIPA